MYYSLMGKMRLPFIDSDSLYYRGALKAGFTVPINFIIQSKLTAYHLMQ